MLAVVDRLEILNLMNLYAVYYDDRRYDEWLDLFTEDAVFAFPSSALTGREAILTLTAKNEAWHARGCKGRHLLPNVAVTEQTASSASIIMYGLVVATESNGNLTSTSPVRYDGELVKDGERWRIRRWLVQLDRPLN